MRGDCNVKALFRQVFWPLGYRNKSAEHVKGDVQDRGGRRRGYGLNELPGGSWGPRRANSRSKSGHGRDGERNKSVRDVFSTATAGSGGADEVHDRGVGVPQGCHGRQIGARSQAVKPMATARTRVLYGSVSGGQHRHLCQCRPPTQVPADTVRAAA
jgi:hypothetical protein